MQIQNSDIILRSEHSKKHEILEKESLLQWSHGERDPRQTPTSDRLELSDDFINKEEASLDPKLQAIIRALESLMGKKVNLSFLKKLEQGNATEPQRVGWGIDYSYEKSEIKEEQVNFSASGSIKTKEGKKIEFSFAYSMQSRSQSHESIHLKAGDALIDPLVVNYGSSVVNIANVKHEFDLDLDGQSDTFSFVGTGSGFLALDKNKDGKINNGSELFGPKSGNGFNELRAYDSDKNNWIDENDAVFEQLLLWTKDEAGEENLFRLSDKDIGALYIGSVSTEFDLNVNNQIQGKVKESSIYLKEDGKVGSVQEIDLVV